MPVLDYPFTEEDARAAHEAWGCNCGPAALAFALQISLDDVRPLLPGFDSKRYVNPSMMYHAIESAGRTFAAVGNPRAKGPKDVTFTHMFAPQVALVRIQWEGPWTEPGANPKWAYRQTHWVATWSDGVVFWVFDVNGGVRQDADWENTIVPLIVESIPRASGGWFPTHIYRLLK